MNLYPHQEPIIQEVFLLSMKVSTTLEDLQGGILDSIKQIVPIPYEDVSTPTVQTEITLKYGVLVGVTGSIKGKILYKADADVFGSIGELMFGMALEGEMLKSFSGELGNMISGGVCTNIFSKGVTIDITAPTIMEGTSTLSGFKEAIEVEITFQNGKKLAIGLMID